MNRRKLLFGLSLLPAVGTAQVLTLRVASIQRDPEAWIALQVLRAVYERAGLRLVPVMLPPLRASVALTGGDADAELMRPLSYASAHPALLRVPTPFYRVSVQAYWLPGNGVTVDSLADLNKYENGTVRGLFASNDVMARVPGARVTQAVNQEQLCRMLDARHIQVAVDTRLRMLHMLHQLGMDYAKSSPELAQFDLYHFVSPQMATVVPRIDEAIRSIGPAGLDKLAEQNLQAAMAMKLKDF